jgi:DNA-binding IclR family transcriptional regulator
VQEVGARRPIYCTAVGKALAAWIAEPELEGIIARATFTPHTPRTITTPAAFRREMARIRAAGFAIDNEEHQPAIRCIATPVRDHTGEVRASRCVVGPTSRMPQRRLAQIRRPLAAVAAALSARLGYETDGRAAGAEQPRSAAQPQQDTSKKGGVSHTLPARTRTGCILRKGEAQ